MPDFPNDWLGWITLIGAIAGIAASIKVFFYERWLNHAQRRLLVAAYLNEYKTISAIKVLGGGWSFHIPNSKNYYNFFIKGGPNEVASYNNLIYLKELVEKGYLVYSKGNAHDDIYYLTAKGLRYGRFFRYIVKEPKAF